MVRRYNVCRYRTWVWYVTQTDWHIMTDRLGDCFYNDAEIAEFDSELLVNSSRYSTKEPVKKTICAYEFWTKDGNTKIVTILAAEDAESTGEALERDWSETKMSPILGNMGTEQWNAEARLEALYVVLDKYRFTTDIQTQTSDRLFKWRKWMKELI